MFFASKFVLANEEDEYESMSEKEFEEGMHVSEDSSSDNDETEQEQARHEPFARSLSARAIVPEKKKRLHSAKYHWKRKAGVKDKAEPEAGASGSSQAVSKRRFRKADTNVVSVKFDTLLSPGNMYAGDPVPCPKCSAVLSHISKTEGDDPKVWPCEFCSEHVLVDLEPEEIPGTEDVTYLLSPAPATASSTMAGQDCSLVIFCMDTSGSMCVTSEISGKVTLRGTNQLRRLQSFREDQSDQFLPSQTNRQVTYVSRLQAMQAAVDHQLAQMALTHPDRRVAMVAFNSEVTVMGDGSQEEVVVAGDKLNDLNKLREVTQDLSLPQAIKTSRQVLGEKVYSLEEGGATALGPALVVAVNMAATHPGSKVILCTDGKANIGLGRLEGDGQESDQTAEIKALDFYNKVAEEAAEKGVTVSVITIQGTDCKLVHLGTMADKTGGHVNIVDCMKLTEEFGNILADPIIATKVKATFLLHKELYVVDDEDPENQPSRAEQNVGNVKSSSSITFEFAKRKSKKECSGDKAPQTDTDLNVKQQLNPVGQEGSSAPQPQKEAGATDSTPDNSAKQELPFQLQIEYMDAEGNKALRVITRRMPVTTNRQITEEAVNLEVLGAHAAKKSADLALQGQYSRSRGVALMNQRLAWRQAHSEGAPKAQKTAYKNIFSKIKNVENFVQRKQMSEISMYGATRSDSEGEDSAEDRHQDEARDRLAASSHGSQTAAPLGRMVLSKGSRKRSKHYISSKNRRMQSERSSEIDDGMAQIMYRLRSVAADEISSEVAPSGDTRIQALPRVPAPVPISSTHIPTAPQDTDKSKEKK